MSTSLQNLEHDVTHLIGPDHATALNLLGLLDTYNTLRQEFRSMLRQLQADPLVVKKMV